jgi:cytochrome P450/ferredoxin-NADP reductase
VNSSTFWRLHTMATSATCPFQNPRDLFSDFASLRDQPGLPFSSHLDAHIVSRYNDIVSVLDRPDVFSSKPTIPEAPAFVKALFAGKVPDGSTLLNWDNPDHDRLRQSVASFFVPRRLERFAPMIAREAQKLIDDFATKGNVDLKAAFALPLPLKVIAAVAGLDPARWDWIGRSLALFGGHAAMRTGTFEEQIQGILDIHGYIAELIQARKSDRRDDLISHIWNQRDAKIVEMTDMEHLMMIPGLLLAGHETTTNFLSMSMSHILSRGMWNEVSKNDETIKEALEELLRYESAITGMRRVAVTDTSIGGCPVSAGTPLFVAYNSGSRDPTVFQDPETLKMGRKTGVQHLAFGMGIHACLGAPLARILLREEMRALASRLPDLRLTTPYDEIQYDRIHEGRGIESLDISWATQSLPNAPKEALPTNLPVAIETGDIPLLIVQAKKSADNVLQLSMEGKDHEPLPEWSPGSHIDVKVGTLGYRQYSLCSNAGSPGQWRIAVLLEEQGTGGSHHIHQNLRPGDIVTVRGARNHFKMEPSPRYLFVAGGIGITPITSMLDAAKKAGSDYRLIYLGRTRSSMAFSAELSEDPAVTIWPKDEKGHFDISRLAAEDPALLKIYCCGPERLLKSVEEACATFPVGTLNVERFTAQDQSAMTNTRFKVKMARSGRVLDVPSERTLLDVLNANGASVLSTCSKGTCGTCEVPVVGGVPEHRDTVLTAVEKLEGKTMMPCVSRCVGEMLSLDLW